jgi:PD-(D/E)XK endonuclease
VNERRINRRRQGDLGETSAIEWLTRMGATVFVPLGHSPDIDLIADLEGRTLRIQVKTSCRVITTPDGYDRYVVALATCGGNQSWNKRVKYFDASRVDYLFALTAEGRRWLIPSSVLEARNAVTLGGPKYASFEIEPARPIHELVYGAKAPLESAPPGEYRSGQPGRPVKALAQPSQVRILPPPFKPAPAPEPARQLRLAEPA